MTGPKQPQRLALLVGIDHYLDGGDKTRTSINDLYGCVNDVESLETLLQTHYASFEVRKLVSPHAPEGPERLLPTHANITREIANASAELEKGDHFYFHFSGHGDLLPLSDQSPNDGRSHDPSLLPVDYSYNKSAIRGWELNQYLQLLERKGIHVLVTLDSCYAYRSWRLVDKVRSPTYYHTKGPDDPPVGQPSATGARGIPATRDASRDYSWDINPENFTLLAACQGREAAYETMPVDDKSYGAFTHALVSYLLSHPDISSATYQDVHGHVATSIKNQTPRLFGREMLGFLSSKETVRAVGRAQMTVHDGGSESVATLFLGRIHALQQGTELKVPSESTTMVLSVDKVDELSSSAQVLSYGAVPLRAPTGVFDVIALRWAAGKSFWVSARDDDPERQESFQRLLGQSLEQRIVGGAAACENTTPSQAALGFTVKRKRRECRVEILGPAWLIGYDGPVRALEGAISVPESDEEQATWAAIATAHLLRFAQVLRLPEEQSKSPRPFSVTISSDEGHSGESPREEGQKLKFTLENKSDVVLHVCVLVLGPGFSVRKLYPSKDAGEAVAAGKSVSFHFRLEVPRELKRATAKNVTHRDIVRAVVTQGKKVSLNFLEMAHIWHAGRVDSVVSRDASLEKEDTPWWVEDCERHSFAKE